MPHKAVATRQRTDARTFSHAATTFDHRAHVHAHKYTLAAGTRARMAQPLYTLHCVNAQGQDHCTKFCIAPKCTRKRCTNGRVQCTRRDARVKALLVARKHTVAAPSRRTLIKSNVAHTHTRTYTQTPTHARAQVHNHGHSHHPPPRVQQETRKTTL